MVGWEVNAASWDLFCVMQLFQSICWIYFVEKLVTWNGCGRRISLKVEVTCEDSNSLNMGLIIVAPFATVECGSRMEQTETKFQLRI